MPENQNGAFEDIYGIVEDAEPGDTTEPVEKPEPEGDPQNDDGGNAEQSEVENGEDSQEENPAPPEEHPIERKFKELGLNQQFTSVDDLLSRVPHMRKWQTQLAQENAELRKLAEQKTATTEEPTFDPNEFVENPDKYLGGKYSRVDEVAQLKQEIASIRTANALNEFRSGHPDAAEYEQTMAQILQDDPAILQTKDPIGNLYRLAKAMKPPAVTAAVEKTKERIDSQVSREKVSATTTPSKPRKPKASDLSPQDLYSLSLDELKRRFSEPGEEEMGF